MRTVKGKLRSLAADLARYSGLLRASEFASARFELRNGRVRRSEPKIVILCYHRIGTGGVPFYSELPTSLFEAQMRYIKSHYRIVPLAEVPQLLASGDSNPAIAVTFDDGYLGTYTEAFPILRRHDIPATTYLTVDCIETGTLAWYDRIFLALQVWEKNSFTIDVAGTTCKYGLNSSQTRLEAAFDINRRLRRIDDEERLAIVAEIDRRIPLPAELTRDRMLNWSHVREMQTGNHTFGCHTMTHPAVSRLKPHQYDYELRQSRELLEQRIGRSASDFAFPFGNPLDCGDVSAILPELGYRTATTMNYGVNERKTDLFRLYRFASVEDPTSLFAYKLSMLFLTGESATAPSPRMVSAEQPKGVSV